MRRWFAIVAMFLASSAHADDDAPTLKVGDPAPRLVVTKWLKGEPISEFEPGKIYVLDMWATWCGPCINSFPEVERLSAEYGSKGVQFIAATSADDHNTLEAATEFVAGPGKAYKLRFAFCKHEDLNLAYLVPAGQKSIPCSFVIGGDGKLAFIGSPRDLHIVLPRIHAGTWKGTSSMEEWNAAKTALKSIYAVASKDLPKATEQLEKFPSNFPFYAESDDVQVAKLLLYLQGQKLDHALTVSQQLLAAARARKNSDLASITGKLLGNPELNPQKRHIALASEAFDLAMELETVDTIGVRLDAIEVHLAADQPEKAAEAGRQAITEASRQGEERKKIVEAEVKKKLAPCTK